MLLNRNSSNKESSSFGLFFIVIVIIMGIIAFGARHKIKEELYKIVKVDREEVEKIVHEFIDKNPQVIIRSVQEMQKREYEEMAKQAQMKIHNKKDELQGKDNKNLAFAGNAKGDVVIVTFLDYRCGHCKQNNRDLKELVKKDPNVKIVFKELPVLGPPSQKLARMALAVQLIDSTKYVEFHNALMDVDGLNDSDIEKILKKLNLSPAKVNDLMNDARVQKELDEVSALAAQLDIRGTPAFIIDEELTIGAIDMNSMMEKIKEVRAKKDKK
jgi:protein-disulfide isomerase